MNDGRTLTLAAVAALAAASMVRQGSAARPPSWVQAQKVRGAWAVPDNPLWTPPASVSQVRFDFDQTSWGALRSIRALVVDLKGRIYGMRKMHAPKQDGYVMRGRVSVGGKKWPAFTGSTLFVRPDGTLVDVATLVINPEPRYAPELFTKRASVAGAQYVPRRRGSRAARPSKAQQMIYRIKNQFPNPETFVRTADFLLMQLPDVAIDLPGAVATRDELLQDVRDASGNPDANFEDYKKLLLTLIRENTYKDVLEEPGLDLEGDVEWQWERYAPWLASQINKMVKLKNQGRINESTMLDQISRMNSELGYVFDWVYGVRPQLGRLSFDEAYQQSRNWHDQAREQANKAKIQRLKKQGKWFDCPDGISSQDPPVVFTFDNGFTVRKLTTWTEFQDEANFSKGGGCLHHCVGNSDNYYNRSTSGEISVYSLRTPDNKPMVTITVNNRSQSVEQAKGLHNRLVGSEGRGGQGIALMRRLGSLYPDLETYLDAECVMTRTFLESIGNPRWNVDASPCEQRFRRIRAQMQRGAQA
jgi:hypothetical protein